LSFGALSAIPPCVPRILFVTTTYPLAPGDAIPAFVADCAQALVRHHGCDVKVIAPGHPTAPARETVNGVEVERFDYAPDPAKQCVAYGGGIPDNLRNFPRAKYQLPGFFAAMAAAVWRNVPDVDLVHAHWVEPAFLSMLATGRRRPVVISVHSLKPKRSRLHAWTLRRADRVLFNSNYTLGQAREKGYACRAQVVYQGYDEALFGPQPRTGAARRALGVPDDAPLVVALGRMIEVKGLHVLAEAANTILRSRPTAHLVIAGDGPERKRIQAIVDASPFQSRIHLPGALPRAQVARLHADADLFVNPGVVDSRGRAEGLGITTLEAMASGLPVVGSRVGGITETIFDGETGVLVPPGDAKALAAAVGQLIDDPATRRRMSLRAREIARERFTWPALAGQVAGVYREVLGVDR